MPTNLFVLIFAAKPLDYARYRHTALYIEFEPQAEAEQAAAATEKSAEDSRIDMQQHAEQRVSSLVMEIKGVPGCFEFFEYVNSMPVSKDLARAVRVASMSDSISISALRKTVSKTRILPEWDWNSQNWIGEVLGRMVDVGYINSEDRDRGLDEMVDVILEAADEEV